MRKLSVIFEDDTMETHTIPQKAIIEPELRMIEEESGKTIIAWRELDNDEI